MDELELKKIINRMLYYQESYFGKKDVGVFRKSIIASRITGGFDWEATSEGYGWWVDKLRVGGSGNPDLVRLLHICPPGGFNLEEETTSVVIDNQKYVL